MNKRWHKNLHDVAVGDVLTYQVQFQIPHDIGALADHSQDTFKCNQFKVLDYMTKEGLTFKALTAITVDGQDILKALTGKMALHDSNDAAWQRTHNYPFGFELDFLGGVNPRCGTKPVDPICRQTRDHCLHRNRSMRDGPRPKSP